MIRRVVRRRVLLWFARMVREAFDREMRQSEVRGYNRGYDRGHRHGKDEAFDEVAGRLSRTVADIPVGVGAAYRDAMREEI